MPGKQMRRAFQPWELLTTRSQPGRASRPWSSILLLSLRIEVPSDPSAILHGFHTVTLIRAKTSYV
jgi:hypothetical protein